MMSSLTFLAVLCSTAYIAFAQNTPIRPPFLPGPPAAAAAAAPRLPSKGVAGLARQPHKSLLYNPYMLMMGDKYFEVAALDMLMDPASQVSPIQQMVIAKSADLNPVEVMFANRMRGSQGAGMRSLYPAILAMM